MYGQIRWDIGVILIPIPFAGFPNIYCPYVDTVGRNKKQIAEYIRNQLASDQIADQIGLKEFVDPFTGRENKKA